MMPEAEFVIGLASGDFDRVSDCLLRPLDTGRLRHLINVNQVGPLCYWAWKRRGGPRLPAGVLSHIRHEYLHHTVRNEHFGNALADLHAALSKHNVSPLYLKGPWLAFHAYPEPGTRPIGDIDLCVRPEHYGHAVTGLAEAGYESTDEIPSDPAGAVRRAQFARQLRFVGRGRPPVELHFRLVNMGPPDPDETWIWATARTVDVGPASIQVPGPEAMILHLLLHAGQHAFSVLRLLHDIRWAVAQCPDVDWRMVDESMHRYRCRTAAYHSLLLAGEIAGAQVPESVLAAWRPSRLRQTLFSWVWKLARARRLEVPRPRMEVESPMFYLLEMGALNDKWRYLAGMARAAGGRREVMTRLQRLRESGQPDHLGISR